MHRLRYISLFLLLFATASQAQKKFEYVDTALLQQEEISAPVEEFSGNDSAIPVEHDVEADVTEPMDTTLTANYLFLPLDSVKQWRREKAYAYTTYLDSLLRAKNKSKTKSTIRVPQGGLFNNFLGSGFVSVLLWTLAILFVVFIVYRLFLADGAFKRKTTQVNNALAEAEEGEISSDSDFDGLISHALQSGNYRLAVRYQYLRALHTLANRSLLVLAPDKTNFQYVREIANRELREAFAAITLHYDYVWYGEFRIDQPAYQRIEKYFTDLNQKLI